MYLSTASVLIVLSLLQARDAPEGPRQPSRAPSDGFAIGRGRGSGPLGPPTPAGPGGPGGRGRPLAPPPAKQQQQQQQAPPDAPPPPRCASVCTFTYKTATAFGLGSSLCQHAGLLPAGKALRRHLLSSQVSFSGFPGLNCSPGLSCMRVAIAATATGAQPRGAASAQSPPASGSRWGSR